MSGDGLYGKREVLRSWSRRKRSIGRELLMTMNIYNVLAERRLLPPVAVKGPMQG